MQLIKICTARSVGTTHTLMFPSRTLTLGEDRLSCTPRLWVSLLEAGLPQVQPRPGCLLSTEAGSVACTAAVGLTYSRRSPVLVVHKQDIGSQRSLIVGRNPPRSRSQPRSRPAPFTSRKDDLAAYPQLQVSASSVSSSSFDVDTCSQRRRFRSRAAQL